MGRSAITQSNCSSKQVTIERTAWSLSVSKYVTAFWDTAGSMSFMEKIIEAKANDRLEKMLQFARMFFGFMCCAIAMHLDTKVVFIELEP